MFGWSHVLGWAKPGPAPLAIIIRRTRFPDLFKSAQFPRDCVPLTTIIREQRSVWFLHGGTAKRVRQFRLGTCQRSSRLEGTLRNAAYSRAYLAVLDVAEKAWQECERARLDFDSHDRNHAEQRKLISPLNHAARHSAMSYELPVRRCTR